MLEPVLATVGQRWGANCTVYYWKYFNYKMTFECIVGMQYSTTSEQLDCQICSNVTLKEFL